MPDTAHLAVQDGRTAAQPLYLDTHTGPVIVTLTGRETVSRHGTRYIEVAGWLADPMYVSEDRLATDPRVFERNTMASFRR